MLDTFRENARSWVIQLIIAALSLVFILSFGVGSKGFESGPGEAGWAAKVNGQEVPVSSFNDVLRRVVYFKQMMSRGEYTADQARADKVRETALKEAEDRELVAQAGLHAGLWVDDDEVVKQILDSDQFKRNGQFDEETYKNYVANAEGTSPARYEQRLRRELLVQRSFGLAMDAVAVSDDEVRSAFVQEHEAASLDYVRFSPAQFRSQVQVTDAEVADAVQKRSAEIAKKYEESRFLYLQPEAMKVRRLFEPVPLNATPDQEKAAKDKVDAAKKALDSGKSWDELAKTFTHDPAAQDANGGIGWVEQGRSPFGKPFEDQVFQLKPGETSGVVRDHFGYGIIQAEEHRPAAEKKLADVQNEIAKNLLTTEKAEALAKSAAEAALAKLKAGTPLAEQFPKAAAPTTASPLPPPPSKSPEAATTAEFHPTGGMISGLGAVPHVSEAAFSLTAEKRIPDQVIADQGAFWVIALRSRTRADLSQLDAEKDTLRQKLVGEKQGELRQAWVDALRAKATVAENPDVLSYEQHQTGYSGL